MRQTTSTDGVPGVLLVPGWDDQNPAFYRELALQLTGRGWVCHTLDLPDPASSQAKAQATREHNLQDLR